MGLENSWRILADRALREYGIANPQVEFIRHNENITCKVLDDERGQQYVLRIHKPIQGFDGAFTQHSYQAVTAEMKFIKAIGTHTDIGVQEPVQTKTGSLVAQIANGDEMVCATLLTWVEGRPMHHDDPDWAEEAYATGVMVAKLHDFAAGWQPVPPLTRHHYGREKLEAVQTKISQGLALGLFNPRQLEIVQAGAEKIIALMDELGHRASAKGLIHADLSKGNLIVQQGRVVPIDFCLCGYGYFYMDLGGISADFGPLAIRMKMLEGYRTVRSLPQDDLKFIEGFFVMGILLFMAAQLHNPKVHEWFGRRMQPICQDYILPLIEGRSFYNKI